jgi:regulator of sirC expression with transglutaminase-like and TPR domain
MVSRNDEDINLAEAALLYAKEEYPDLDIETYFTKINLIAEEINKNLSRGDDPNYLITEINRYLFSVAGFRGNRDDYYDPKNSFLNDVLDRKKGIPITLSVLYMEIANRLGLNLEGVGFPGHFIVRYSGTEGEILIDPFNEGRTLSQEDCQDILDRAYNGGVKFQGYMLQLSTKKQILVRMLNNLKNIYWSSKNYLKALSIVEFILLITPDSVTEIRDRGMIYYQLECFSQALLDLEKYLKIYPEAPDEKIIRGYFPLLKELSAKIN